MKQQTYELKEEKQNNDFILLRGDSQCACYNKAPLPVPGKLQGSIDYISLPCRSSCAAFDLTLTDVSATAYLHCVKREININSIIKNGLKLS